jgi:hypothetical protein
MGPDQRCAVGPCPHEREIQSLLEADELMQPDREGMGGLTRVGVVEGQLEPRNEQQPVGGPCALGLLEQLCR